MYLTFGWTLLATLLLYPTFGHTETPAPTLTPTTPVALNTGGVVIEFPRGRLQENSSPVFFRWTNVKPAHSLTLKVFRANPDGTFNEATDLLARFDFAGNVQSLNWSQQAFARGHYSWQIAGYDQKSANPHFVDSASFSVEELKQIDLQTTRFGLLVGFSRGKYKSLDPTFEVEFDTTPTRYGVSFKGGRTTTSWEVNTYASDFVLRGGVQRTATVAGGYQWRFFGENAYELQGFAGPTLRAIQFPRARSLNGTDIEDESVTLVSPGATLSLRKQMDVNLTLYSQFGIDTPVTGSDDIVTNDISYRASIGTLFALFWPFGISGEVQYSEDKFSTEDGADDVEITMSEWAIIGNLVYSF